jgi:hypothetical protein
MVLSQKTRKNAKELEDDFSYKNSDIYDDSNNKENALFTKNE